MWVFVFLWRLSGVRLEEFIYEKVQGKRPILLVDEGLLGQYMVQAGNQFDANTAYGMSHLHSTGILTPFCVDVPDETLAYFYHG